MADPLVIDSDLLINYLRGTEPDVSCVLELARSWRMLVTSITVRELRVGMTDSEGEAFKADVARRTLVLDVEAALVAGRVGRALRQQGRPIGVADELIAGTCLRFGLPFATRNRKHFGRVPGLQLVDL